MLGHPAIDVKSQSMPHVRFVLDTMRTAQLWCHAELLALSALQRCAEAMANLWTGVAPVSRRLGYAVFAYWLLGTALVDLR